MKTPRWWFDGARVPLWARALAPLYAQVAAHRRNTARSRVNTPMPVPVVVIGNIIAGGAGKTPLTLAMVQRLREWGWRPGIATRGAGRSSTNAQWVEEASAAGEVGDEPILLARRSGVPVRVDAKRAEAARALMARGCDIVVCDDGLQHYALPRDVEIEVSDGRGYGNGLPMPAGPLREPVTRAEACNFRVVNGANIGMPLADGRWPMQLVPGAAIALDGSDSAPLSAFAGQRVHALAGIAHPQRFFAMLRGQGIEVIEHPFADHHAFQPADLAFRPELPILMTEKDAVKITPFAPANSFSVPVDAALPEAFWQALRSRLDQLGAARMGA